MNTTFESLTKGAKDCYNYYIASKGSNNRQALSNARVFIEYIPKLGILEFCQKYYNNDLFNILTDRNHQLIYSKSDKQYYIVEMSDINNAKTSKFKTNAYQLRQDGYSSVQIDIDNSFITENNTYSTHSSGLFSILSSLIGLHTNSPFKRIRNIENNFKALYSECNKATHPSDDAEIDDAATEVYDNLDNAIEKFIRFIDKTKILSNTKAFLKETVGRHTDKSQAKIETTPPKSSSNTISITTPESEATSNNRVITPKPTQSNNNNKAKSPTNTDLLFDNLFGSFGNYPSKAKERERDNDRREAELKRQQEQKKEKEIELIKRIIICNDSIWRYENHCPPSDEAIRLFGEFAGIQEREKTRLIASKELERLNPSFKIVYCNSLASGLICPNGKDLYEIKKYNTYSDFTEGFFHTFHSLNNRPSTEKEKIARERNKILEKATEIRNTFFGAVLNVAISIILILFFWDVVPTHSWIKYACLIATISIGAFVPFTIDLIFTAISNDSQFLTKPFISQAKESLKIRVRDDFKWTITEFGPSWVSVAIATLTLFLTDNAILSVLIGNFGIILTTQIICFKNFHDRKNMKQFYQGPFYYPQSTHWVSIFTNAFISFSIPVVIYLLFFA